MEPVIFPSGRQLFGAARQMIRPFFLAALLLTMGVFPLAGQGNQPSKPISQAERERLFKAGLKQDPPPKGAIELVLKRKIPRDEDLETKDIIFRNVLGFSVDNRGHVFIPESHFTAVYEFDRSGRLLRKYDRKGRGPGELVAPGRVLFSDGKIVIHDGQPRRISYFDRQWKFLKSFQYSIHFSPYIIGSSGLIYGIRYGGDYLVDVMDSSGRIVSSFGSLPAAKGSPLNAAMLTLSPSGSIWVSWQALGKLKRYSAGGILQKEIDFMAYASPKLKSLLKRNLEWEKKGKPEHSLLIQRMAFCGDDLFVQAGGLLTPIFRFSQDGQYKAAYYIKPSKSSIWYDGIHVAIGEDGKEEFYIMSKDHDEGDIRVEVYSPKTVKRLP